MSYIKTGSVALGIGTVAAFEIVGLSMYTSMSGSGILGTLCGTAVVIGFAINWASGDRPWHWLSR